MSDLRGKLPEDFPGKAALEAAGITTYAQLRDAGDVTEIEGIGPATKEKIDERLAGDGADAPERTTEERAVDDRVNAETERLAKQRAQQNEFDRLRAINDLEASEKGLFVRATDHALGLVEHMGCAGRYVGKAPQSEEGDSLCPQCQVKLIGGNSKFYPLPYIVPEAGLLVKDPNSGEFYALPHDGTLAAATAETWLTISNPTTGEPLVPEADKKASEQRRAAAGLAA